MSTVLFLFFLQPRVVYLILKYLTVWVDAQVLFLSPHDTAALFALCQRVLQSYTANTLGKVRQDPFIMTSLRLSLYDCISRSCDIVTDCQRVLQSYTANTLGKVRHDPFIVTSLRMPQWDCVSRTMRSHCDRLRALRGLHSASLCTTGLPGCLLGGFYNVLYSTVQHCLYLS